MRLVVDTNVFVSAALKQASPPSMVVRWLDRYGGLLKSAQTEAELLAVLRRPRIASKVSPGFEHNIITLLAAAETVQVVDPVAECRDPGDDKFLALAAAGLADVIISGDSDLLVLGSFRAIPIVTPAAFVYGQP